ncbi:MAG: porin [Rhodocyclaceae bacterium]|nr:porin [Rhodocyclaceae bacterium]
MQKKIIALAVAGLVSGAAFAQTNVTIYGVADGSFEMTKGSGGNGGAIVAGAQTVNSFASKNRVAANASLIGFRGSEDLGQGLKAVFQFENELDITSGNNAVGGAAGNVRPNGLGNRDTFVGLAGGFGTVAIGWLSSPHRSTGAKFDVMPGAAGAGGSLNIIGRVNTGSIYNGIGAAGTTAHTFGNTGTLANNVGVIGRHSAIAYISPKFSGLNGVLAFVPGENEDNTATAATRPSRNPSAWNLALHYDMGPLSVSYSFLNIKDFGTGQTAATMTALDLSGAEKHKAQLLAARYVFGDTTASFMWDTVKSNLADGAAAGITGDVTNKRNAWYLGLAHKMGANNVSFAYAKAGDNSVGLGSRAVVGINNNTGSGAKMLSLRYGYDFSKRTQAYGQYSKISNGNNASYDFGVTSTNLQGAGNGAVFAGADPQIINFGIRHTF